VRYPDGTLALRDVTLLAAPGETVAVIGPSGCGKSTLLRAIAGLVRPTAGRVLIGGEGAPRDPAQRNVGMVFEESHLVPFLDVAHNISFPLDIRHVPHERAREAVERQANRLGILSVLRRRPATLSAGEASQVGIGRALVRQPTLFLLDEPLSHVDASERVSMRHRLRDAISTSAVTTFWVTHDQEEALSLGDRVAVMADGQVVQVATPAELYARPATAFVAEFVGAAPIGFLPARLVESSGLAGYDVGFRILPTWAPVPAELRDHRDRQLRLAVRPEDIHEDPLPEHGTITGLVTRVERTGHYAYVTLLAGGHRLTARFSGRTEAGLGMLATVGIDVGRAHVFDAETGRALYHPSGSRP
jgi:ABC-type sugar transport system ATPase subunit